MAPIGVQCVRCRRYEFVLGDCALVAFIGIQASADIDGGVESAESEGEDTLIGGRGTPVSKYPRGCFEDQLSQCPIRVRLWHNLGIHSVATRD